MKVREGIREHPYKQGVRYGWEDFSVCVCGERFLSGKDVHCPVCQRPRAVESQLSVWGSDQKNEDEPCIVEPCVPVEPKAIPNGLEYSRGDYSGMQYKLLFAGVTSKIMGESMRIVDQVGNIIDGVVK